MHRKQFHFSWASSPIDINLDNLYKLYIRRGYYSEPHLRHFTGNEEEQRKKQTLIKLKLTEKAARRKYAAQSLFPKRLPEIHTIGVLGMARKYDIPPYQIYVALKQHSPELISEDQHARIMNIDILSPESVANTRQKADDYESAIINALRAYGVSFLTEIDIKNWQIVEYGRVLSTPDIYFLDDVFINGKRVYWLECKDYILAPNQLILPKVKQQLSRYIHYFGTGAVLYSQGYICDIDIPGVQVIDGNIEKIELTMESIS